jgi:TolB-like protein
MTDSTKAVFLSYASQDAEAARRICEALRAAGIEVWFDQNELRGGDAWDQRIHQQIHDCALFVPLISVHTDARTEGYFRLEWKLAVDRSHLMADDAAFLVPVVIDGASEASARVPDKFQTLQWTRLPGGEAPAEFCRWIKALLAGTARPVRRQDGTGNRSGRHSSRMLLIAGSVALLLAAIAVFTWRTMSRTPGVALTPRQVATSPASTIPEHSIAVLPFANLSAQREEEYFSDGLAEDLLNLLSKVPGLQVAARTSAFSFKGNSADIPTIGRKLKVASVLEGTVRKVGNHLRVTAQLERAADGYQIWSESYDRELGDVFRMQDEIANSVVKSLKVSLLWGAAPRSLGTQNSEAYLVFLQGRAKMATQRLADIQEAAVDFARTLKLDPNYAPAYVELASAKLQLAEFDFRSDRMAAFESASNEGKLLIEQALALDPKDAQAYVVRGYLRAFRDRAGAEQDFRRGIELNPNSARGYEALATLLYDDLERRDEVLAMLTRAHQLDPLDPKFVTEKAKLLAYGRSDLREAGALLAEVVARPPVYQPAVMILADVRRFEGNSAEAIMYDEQALKLSARSEWSRRELIQTYIDIADIAAARQVADEAPQQLPIQRLSLLNAAGDWHQAAQVAYAALADGTLTVVSEPYAVFAMRMDAHRSRDYQRARAALEKISEVTWSAAGVPALPEQAGFGYAAVALGDMLIASGERARGERLLRESLAAMDYAAHDLKRGDLYFLIDRATALALLGDRRAALAALHKAVAAGFPTTWCLIEVDPAFDALRTDPEFQNLMRAIKVKQAHEREILARMRADGRVPKRGANGSPAAPQA